VFDAVCLCAMYVLFALSRRYIVMTHCLCVIDGHCVWAVCMCVWGGGVG